MEESKKGFASFLVWQSDTLFVFVFVKLKKMDLFHASVSFEATRFLD